jgi:hypothetical protein
VFFWHELKFCYLGHSKQFMSEKYFKHEKYFFKSIFFYMNCLLPLSNTILLKKKTPPVACSVYWFHITQKKKKKKSRNLMFIYQYLAFFCHKPSTQPSKLRVKIIIKAINALFYLGYDDTLNLS